MLWVMVMVTVRVRVLIRAKDLYLARLVAHPLGAAALLDRLGLGLGLGIKG